MTTLDQNREAIRKAIPWLVLALVVCVFAVGHWIGRTRPIASSAKTTNATLGVGAIITESSTHIRVVLKFMDDGTVEWVMQ